jgi:hypothetical protein
MGAARCAVGVALIAAPSRALGITRREEPTPASLLLMRTIGIRDLVIGVGTMVAARSGHGVDARRWLRIGLTSDSLDALTGLASARAIGTSDAVVAVGAALTFVGLDQWALRSLERANDHPLASA